MKNFKREHPQFSLCGLNCILCSMYVGEYCPGCGGGEGNQGCAIARCAVERAAGEFCGQCFQFPCERYQQMMKYDSFVPHSHMAQDLERVKLIGLGNYLAEIGERRAILDQLLSGWNDGRRKSFYCLAVYLLDLDGLRRAFEEIQAAVSEKMSVKQKAFAAVAALKTEAQRQGITLKLNKKPKET